MHQIQPLLLIFINKTLCIPLSLHFSKHLLVFYIYTLTPGIQGGNVMKPVTLGCHCLPRLSSALPSQQSMWKDEDVSAGNLSSFFENEKIINCSSGKAQYQLWCHFLSWVKAVKCHVWRRNSMASWSSWGCPCCSWIFAATAFLSKYYPESHSHPGRLTRVRIHGVTRNP